MKKIKDAYLIPFFKFFIFKKNLYGKSILVTGSYNPTNHSNKHSWDNIIILDNPNIIDKYIERFEEIKQQSSNTFPLAFSSHFCNEYILDIHYNSPQKRTLDMPIIFLAVATLASFNIFYAHELPVYKKTEHFTILCRSQEHTQADQILQESQKLFEQLSYDFQHDYSAPITIKIYPKIPTHEQKDQSENANVIFNAQEHTYDLALTQNTQLPDAYEGIIKINNVQLAALFITDKYPHADIPQWLYQGLALYLGNYFLDEEITAFKNTATALPTLQELENIGTDNNNESFLIPHKDMASYLLVEFIDTVWHWSKLLAIVENYSDFENILHYPKKDVEKHWNYHTLFTTHAFKSGDPSLAPLMKDFLILFKKSLSAPYKKRAIPQLEDIILSFLDYRTKIMESDNHILITIQNNTAIAGWALFSLESPSRATLEGLCIHPEYRDHDIGRKLIDAVHKNFRSIKSITTVNKNMNLKTPYFCGTFNDEKKEN